MPTSPKPAGSPGGISGLASLRSGGKSTEILFLYEVATRPHSRLRLIAIELGISVQAASLLYRRLSSEGLVVLSDGFYRLTVRGIASLHASLGSLTRDVEERLERLQVIRRCRAVASTRLKAGAPVDLSMRNGTMYAAPGGSGPSHGSTSHAARAGDLVEVEGLEGILPLTNAKVICLTIPLAEAGSSTTITRLSRAVEKEGAGQLATYGMEAAHALSRATRTPAVRFGVPSAAREASQVGVSTLVVTTDDKLPDLLQKLDQFRPAPPIELRVLGD